MFTPTRADYLGYRTRGARRLRTSAAGPIANIGGPALLDDQLRVDRRLDEDAVLIDRELALVQISAQAAIDPAWLEKTSELRTSKVARVALYDFAKKRELQSWPVAAPSGAFSTNRRRGGW